MRTVKRYLIRLRIFWLAGDRSKFAQMSDRFQKFCPDRTWNIALKIEPMQQSASLIKIYPSRWAIAHQNSPLPDGKVIAFPKLSPEKAIKIQLLSARKLSKCNFSQFNIWKKVEIVRAKSRKKVEKSRKKSKNHFYKRLVLYKTAAFCYKTTLLDVWTCGLNLVHTSLKAIATMVLVWMPTSSP